MALLPGYACSADAASRAGGFPLAASGGGGPTCWPLQSLGHTDDLPPSTCKLGSNNRSSSFTPGAHPHVLALSLSSSAAPTLDVTPMPETGSVGAVGASALHSHHLFRHQDTCRNSPISGYPKFLGAGSKHADYDPAPLAVQPPSTAVAADTLRLPGPLGPFTGYATILRNSKFLRPAQQLLDESCSLAAAASPSFRRTKPCCGDVTNASPGHLSADAGTLVLSSKRTSSPGASSSAPPPSSTSGTPCSRRDGSSGDCDLSSPPAIHDKKAKLLFLQAEVCRKYKQYNQQMQMAVSSFESVAGLSSAIPFLSVAIKSVCKHFRFLKHVIANQLTQISRALGEEFVSSSSSRSDIFDSPRLKFLEQTLRKQKAEQKGTGFSDNRQPVWRPQRGLPERAVAVLRAWLFDHFLHPYPTDADKIMLASQTGLSRNQVSNWFINARVRVWKPMVEEIHKLETKGLNEVNLNSSDSSSTQPDLGHFRNTQPIQEQQQQEALIPSNCSSTVGLLPENHGSCQTDLWHQDKRSRMEVYASSSFGGYGGEMVAGLSAYPGGIDMESFGAVSLTLGLKQDERPWHPQPYQQLRSYFDSPMVHD